MHRNDILIDRIELRCQALGLTDRKASLLAIQKPDLIRDIKRGKEPGAARLRDLAAALQTTTDYLNGSTENPAPVALLGPREIPHPLSLPKDLPVYGAALGAEADIYTGDGQQVIVEMTDLNTGEVIDYFRRPPNAGRDDYVLYVSGGSMAPAHEDGRAVLVSPKRPVLLMDYVVVYLRGRDDDGVVAAMIKRLVRRSAGYIELEQFNPAATFRLEAKQFTAIHKVVPWDEAFGF